MSETINLKSFNFTDDELKELKKKQEEKLERYLKCYNEATERTIIYIQQLEKELKRRDSP
jgi:predicted HicB family RNase H-like nuclease